MTFAGGMIYFKISMNHSRYVDLGFNMEHGFKERIASILSMIHFAIWGEEEDTEFDDFAI